MSNEVILNLSFDNQTVTDLTGNWTLDGTPNATYEQIDGRDGYSIVTGSLGRCIVLNAVDQNVVYNEYTVDFDMFIKSTYTSNYYFYYIIYMWSRINPGNEYRSKIGNVLDIFLTIGGSDRVGTTNYSPIGRWVHVTLTSGPTEVDYQYHTTAYVDGVKLIDRTDNNIDNNPFALSQQILLLTRDTDAKLMPNGPGICLNTFKVVTGIHIPDQNPAISLFNLSRVFNNFCTWLKRQLSTVAFTGSYNDLSNKPTISTVNDGTLTIQRNGTTVDTFTANSSSNKTVNIQCVDLSTAQTIGGVKTFTSNMVIQGSKKVTCNLDNSFIELDGGTTWGKGGSIVLSGQDRGSYNNSVLIVSKSDSNTDILQYQNGELKPLSNNTNNSSLGTSTNKWSKIYSDDVVHTTGNETIGGNKTFSNSPTVARQDVGTIGYNVKLGFKRGSEIATTNHSTFRVVDSDNEIISEICTENYADGKVAQVLNVRNTNNENSQIQSSISHLLDKTGEQDWIVPSRDNKIYLGTSTNRWADVKTALINGKTPAYDPDVVHVKGSDDIIDSKTFISLYTQSSGPSLWMKNTSFTMGTAPTTNRYSGLWVQDNNGTDTAYIVHQANKNNSQNLKFSVSNTDGTTVYQNALTFQGRLDGTFNFYSDNPANLGTSTNKWAKVYSDDIVHTTGNETISGEKTFSNLRTYFGRDISCYSTRKYGKNLNPTSNTYQYLNFSGNTVSEGTTNDWSSGYLEQVVDTNGGSRGRWFIQDTSENAMGIELWASGNDKQLRPYQNNTTDLGTAIKKWKSFNGVNPGALSLPSISNTGVNAWIAIDTTDWVVSLATSNAQKYMPPADGWLNVRVDNAVALGLALTDGGNYMHQMVRSETPSSLALLLPVFKNKEVAILVGGNENFAYTRVTFYPCQGNV